MVRKTRKEKREEKRRREQLLVVTEKEKEKVETSDQQESADKALESSQKLGGDSIVGHEPDVSAENLRTWQAEDNTLKDIWEAVRKCEANKGIGFFHDGLLFRLCRETVLKLAPSISLTGHLGRDKTTKRVLQRFYWPTIHADVAEYCRMPESSGEEDG